MKLKYYLRGLGIGIVVTAIIMSFTRQPEKLTDAQIKMRALELGMVEESVLSDLQKNEEPVSSEKISLDENIKEELNSLVEENSGEASTEEDSEAEDSEEDRSEESLENDAEENFNRTSNEVQQNENLETISNEVQQNENLETTSNEVKQNENSGEVSQNNDTGINSAEVIQNDNTPVNSSSQSNSVQEIVNNEPIENFIVITVESGNDSMVVSNKLYEAGLVNSVIGYNQFLVNNNYDRRIRVGNHEIPVGATEEEMARILCGIN